MRAITFNSPGDASVLHLEERVIPSPGSHEVLIRVIAAGVNRPDIFQRKGRYPAPSGIVQDIPGLEVSGVIESTGVSVSRWQSGQEVCALVAGGGYAEYVTAHEGCCLPVPKGISTRDAAALPEALFTVWHNVFQRGGLKAGQNIFIYGGSGGIGSMAIQLSRLSGAIPFTMTGSVEKAAFCSSLGVEKVCNSNHVKLIEDPGENSMDVILDCLGGDYIESNLTILKPDGRLVFINAMDGRRPELDIMKVMQKRLFITGSTLRSRSYEFKSTLAKDILDHAYPLLEDSRFKNMVHHVFPLEEASEAHRLMESRDFFGKIILKM
ncbi:MAG: NAD(P)H-quinone oxidoreductase [Saprospiraceae bacterium]|nr:NAD(P)H-quinone oxidoreductase [Saprospiraceae bacterium]